MTAIGRADQLHALIMLSTAASGCTWQVSNMRKSDIRGSACKLQKLSDPNYYACDSPVWIMVVKLDVSQTCKFESILWKLLLVNLLQVQKYVTVTL